MSTILVQAPIVATDQPALPDWKRAHEELVTLAKKRAGLDYEEGVSMLRALRAGAHTQLGYASFGEYIERLFGYKPRWTEEQLRVAEALERLPELARALRDGKTSWSAIRELTRVATPETEREWLRTACGQTVRRIERMVCGRKPGDRPSTPPDPSLVKHTLHFEVTAATLATFRDAMSKLRRDAGDKLDDDTALLAMARHVLGGPTDPGRASYQVLVEVCEACGRGAQTGAGESIEVEPEVIEMAECDGQRIDNPHVGGSGNDAPAGSRNPRAKQNVPPAIRREVLRRDHGRCVVPGCSNATFVDIHHLDLRSEGGGHDPDRLVTLCGAHHRALHQGKLGIDRCVSPRRGSRSASTGLVFRHADGSAYGTPNSPAKIELFTKAFQALTGMGFKHSEA